MNEKIKELAEQATRKYDRLGFEIPFAQPDLELFAELIVKECTGLLNQREEEMWKQGTSNPSNQAKKTRSDECNIMAKYIKDHFGVEE
jgi:hypothetical protein